ncbi:MAG: HAD family phosphatase [Chloroflexota bacterium]
MTIKAIIFDFGQVLNAPVDEAAVQAHRAELAARLGLPAAGLWPYLFEGEPAARWMTGRLSWEQYWQEVLAPVGLTDPADVTAFSREVFWGGEQIHPEMRDLLGRLHGRYQLAVLSNADWTDQELADVLTNHYGLPAGLFDTIVTSASAGVVKPDPAIFHLVLQRLGVAPQEAVFTDDMPNFTRAAGQLGLHAHTFTTPAALRAYLAELGVLV